MNGNNFAQGEQAAGAGGPPCHALKAITDSVCGLTPFTFDQIPVWLRNGLTPDALARVLVEYMGCSRRYNELRLEEFRLASEQVSELTSGVSQESQEPSSDVSVGSSASSGRARRRARYRAARRKRESSNATAVTYSVSEVSNLPKEMEETLTGPGVGLEVNVADKPGACYLRLVRPEEVVKVHTRLGMYPKFAEILSLDSADIRTGLDGMCVSRVSDGCFHIGRAGLAVDVAMVSVAVKAVHSGYRVNPGTYAAVLMTRATKACHIDKAPCVDDRLGAPLNSSVSGAIGDIVLKAEAKVYHEGFPGFSASDGLAEGYCYLGMFHPSLRAEVGSRLGKYPALSAVFTQPAAEYAAFLGLGVLKAGKGLYHLITGFTWTLSKAGGQSLFSFAAAAISRARADGVVFPKGCKAEEMMHAVVGPGVVDGLPWWSDKLGARRVDPLEEMRPLVSIHFGRIESGEDGFRRAQIYVPESGCVLHVVNPVEGFSCLVFDRPVWLDDLDPCGEVVAMGYDGSEIQAVLVTGVGGVVIRVVGLSAGSTVRALFSPVLDMHAAGSVPEALAAAGSLRYSVEYLADKTAVSVSSIRYNEARMCSDGSSLAAEYIKGHVIEDAIGVPGLVAQPNGTVDGADTLVQCFTVGSVVL